MLESRDVGTIAESVVRVLVGFAVLHDDCWGCERGVSFLVHDIRAMQEVNLLSTFALMLL